MKSRQWLQYWGLSLALLIVVFGCSSSDDPVTPPDGETACGISITSPVSGTDSWYTGDYFTIRWAKTGSADSVRITLKNDDILVGTINEGTANDGYYRWTASTFGENSGSNYTISISALANDSCSDEKGPYTIINTVGCNIAFTGILANIPDTTFVRDSLLDISWASSNSSGHVKLELIDPIGNIGIISSFTPDDGYYAWPVTSFHNDSYEYFRIKISDVLVGGCSVESDILRIDDDNICQVLVTSPVNHQVLTEGDSFNIMFTMDNMDGNVDLWLYYGFESVSSIVTNLDPFAGTYAWVVNDFDHIGSNQLFRIRVVASDDNYCWGHTAEFTIVQ